MFSMQQMLNNIAEKAGKMEEFNHPFYLKVADMVNNGDTDALVKEKIGTKLLRVTDTGRDGFILTDFPNTIREAEQLEEYRGGMNSFVHLSVPDEVAINIEENKL